MKNKTFSELVNDDTLLLQSTTTKAQSSSYMITFKVLLGVFLGIKFIMSIIIMQWHQRKILGLFSLFLAIPENDIKISH